MLMGTVLGGWQMARAAFIASQKMASGEGDAYFYQNKIITAKFYMEQIMPRSKAYLGAVLAGNSSVMALSVEAF